MRPSFRWLVVFVGYLAAAKLGLLLATHADAITPIWPPTGIALAAILCWGRTMVWPVLLAAAASNVLNGLGKGDDPGTAVALGSWIALGNAAGPLVAAEILRRVGYDQQMGAIRDVWWLFLAAAAGALLSSMNGVTALVHIVHLPLAIRGEAWATWWIGDALGFVGFAPFLMVRALPGVTGRTLAAPLLATAATTVVVGLDPMDLGRWMPTAYLTLLPLVWLGARGGPHAVAVGYIVLAVGLVLATNAGHGPLAADRYRSPLVALAAFLSIAALLTHLLGVWSHRWQTMLGDARARAAADERFRVLFEQSSDAHLIFDESGIIDCNRAAISMLRCPDKSAVLRLHPAALSPELQPDGQRSMEKCMTMDAIARERGFHRFEWTHRRTDGTDFPVEVTLTPVRLGGKGALLVVWHDLTQRKAVEDAVAKARDAAEDALRAKSEFLATMSHELRTPLNGVIGMATLLDATSLAEDQRDPVATIRTCADHLLILINDILDLSRLEAGKIQLEARPVDPQVLVTDVLAMVRAKAEGKGLTCASRPSPCPRPSPPILAGSVRSCSIFLATRSSSPNGGGSPWPSTGGMTGCGSRWATRASAWMPRPWAGCSSLLPRRMPASRAATAEVAWAWPSAAAWPTSWAVR